MLFRVFRGRTRAECCAFGAKRFVEAETWTNVPDSLAVACAVLSGRLRVVISAPAVVLAVVMGFSVTATVLLIALPTAVYTMFGGVQAVTWTDVKQMVLQSSVVSWPRSWCW